MSAIPTYPWRAAPEGLATRRQLAASGLRPGGSPVDPKLFSTPGKELRDFLPPFTLVNDRMEWVLPTTFESASRLGAASADVPGKTTSTRVGPQPSKRSTEVEDATGTIQMLVRAW